jgi:hypothetical protein
MPIRINTKLIPFAAACAVFIGIPIPALASGGFWCDATDKNVKFHVASGTQRGGAGALLNFEANLEIFLKDVPPDFRKLNLSGSLTQHWIDGKDFKLRLYTERNEGLFGAVEFIVDAKAAGEGEYKGTYSLSVENMQSEKDSEAKRWEARGKITCSAE